MTIYVEGNMNITPADWVPGPPQGHWTYNHYAALPDDGKRYEVVDGVLFYMSPASGTSHQKVVLRLASYLLTLVEDAGRGQAFVAPIDVELSPGMVFEPDIVVILNAGRDKVTASHIKGVPDLVIEVASPATRRYDRTTKREAYALAGVSEYWLADPLTRTIEVLSLEGKTYQSIGVFSGLETLLSKVVPTIAEVRVEQFFV